MAINLSEIFRDKKVFITGITGFKGSWMALWLEKLGACVKGYALLPETEPNHYEILGLERFTDIGDIRKPEELERSISDFQPDIVFHLAAQSLVRRSYLEPIQTYETNVMGTLNLLEACRKVCQPKAIIVVTSDKVYENREWHWAYRENEPLGGYDLYSSSKACTDLMTSSYKNSFFPTSEFGIRHNTLLATVRAGNVIGGGDWAADRLVPDVIRATTPKKEASIRNPQAIRPWQHVLDPVSGYLLLAALLERGDVKFSQSWNFGPVTDSQKSVSDVLTRMKMIWNDLAFEYNENEEDLHEAAILAVDSSKARIEMKWSPVWDFDKSVKKTVEWYRSYYTSKECLSEKQLKDYILDAKNLDLGWVVDEN